MQFQTIPEVWKIELGHCPPATLKKNIFARELRSVRFDLLGSINFGNINGSPNWSPEPLLGATLKGPSNVVPLDSTDMISY